KFHKLHIFFESFQLSKDLSFGVESQRASVEDEVCMCSHLVYIQEGGLCLFNIGTQDFQTFVVMNVRKWRCSEVNDDIRILLAEFQHQISLVRVVEIVVPEVFTNG